MAWWGTFSAYMVRIQKQAQHRSNIQIYRYIKGDLLIHLPCTVVTGVAAGWLVGVKYSIDSDECFGEGKSK